MKGEEIELVRGSGNVFRDLGHASPDVEQLKAILAAEIIKMLDRLGLSVRGAHARTGTAAADFSRIRNADLGRFTIDRMVSIITVLEHASMCESRCALCSPSSTPAPRLKDARTPCSGTVFVLRPMRAFSQSV